MGLNTQPLRTSLATGEWPRELLPDVSSLSAGDFEVRAAEVHDAEVQASPDLVAVAIAA